MKFGNQLCELFLSFFVAFISTSCYAGDVGATLEDCSKAALYEHSVISGRYNEKITEKNANFTAWKSQLAAEESFLISHTANYGMPMLVAVETGSLVGLHERSQQFYADFTANFSPAPVLTPRCAVFKRLADTMVIKFREGHGASRTTLLIEAALLGHLSQVAFLLRNLGADAFARDTSPESGFMAIHAAVVSSSLETIKLLLSQHAELIEVRDNHDRTPLLLAASLGHLSALELLLELGSNLMASDYEGYNAMHLAAKVGHDDVIDFLMAKRPEMLASKTKSGHTPVDLYEWRVEDEIEIAGKVAENNNMIDLTLFNKMKKQSYLKGHFEL